MSHLRFFRDLLTNLQAIYFKRFAACKPVENLLFKGQTTMPIESYLESLYRELES